jgi:SET and MYND domain-containing protein
MESEPFGCVHTHGAGAGAVPVCCATDARRGRYLTAARALRPGEVVLSNVPYAATLLDSAVASRCSYCFVRPASSLLRCSRCQYAQYCDAGCQRKGWKSSHKAECASLPAARAAARGNEMFLTDVRLVLISAGNKRSKGDDCTLLQGSAAAAGEEEEEGVVSTCGNAHFARLATGPLFSRAGVRDRARAVGALAGAAPALSPGGASASPAAAEELLAQFACNNFGIVDELLHCVGAAVSPCVALLNHSCCPNCVLRYDFAKGKPPVVRVVAAQEISEGTELAHSYVEVVEGRASRQGTLRGSYGFDCLCARCLPAPAPAPRPIEECYSARQPADSGLVSVPARFAESGSYACFLPSQSRSAAAAQPRTVLDTELVGAATVGGVSVRPAPPLLT